MSLPTNTLDLSPVDWVGKQVQSFREAFWTDTFNNPGLNSLLTVVPGIKAKQQIVILGLLELVGKTKTVGNCAPDLSDQVIPSSEKLWDPEHIEDRFVECWKDLLDKFTVWGLANNIKKPDLTATDFANFLMDRVIDGLVQSIYRIVWFADTAIANVSGGGLLKNGVDVRYFNSIDGLWKQFFAVAAEFPEHYVQIPNNYGGIAAPAAPTLATATTGGTVAAGTYYVQLAYVNASGETVLGPVASQVTAGSTSTITVTTGALPAGATSVKAYISTASGTYTKYFSGTGSPIVITAPPSSGTSGTPATINGATTSAGQAFTASDTTNQLITGIMQQIVDNADTRLVGAMPSAAGKPQFFVTRSVMNQYKAERRKFTNIDAAYVRTEQGFGKMEFDGYDVIELDFEDRIIKSYFNNGTSSYLPHRIYFTSILNLQMGCEEEGSMTDTDAFYVPESKNYYIDTLYTIDVKEIEDYKVSLAY